MQEVEYFQQRCRQAASFLIRVMVDLSASSQIPATYELVQTAIEQHDETMRVALGDCQLVTLMSEGYLTLEKLRSDVEAVKHCHDCM